MSVRCCSPLSNCVNGLPTSAYERTRSSPSEADTFDPPPPSSPEQPASSSAARMRTGSRTVAEPNCAYRTERAISSADFFESSPSSRTVSSPCCQRSVFRCQARRSPRGHLPRRSRKRKTWASPVNQTPGRPSTFAGSTFVPGRASSRRKPRPGAWVIRSCTSVFEPHRNDTWPTGHGRAVVDLVGRIEAVEVGLDEPRGTPPRLRPATRARRGRCRSAARPSAASPRA